MNIIAPHPTPEMYRTGLEIDCQCAGYDGHCDGTGVWHSCLSSPEWCQANPLSGRESVERGAIEWYTVGDSR